MALRRGAGLLLIAGALSGTTPVAGQGNEADPLRALVGDALRQNAALEAERWAAVRTAAEVRQARALFLPSVQFDARYSEQRGTVDLGEALNPAYAALNQVLGESRFPTDLALTLPQRHDSRVRLTQPVANAALWANHAVARHRHTAQSAQLSASARRVAAEVQLSYWVAVSAARTVEIYEATLPLVRENERVTKRLLEAGRATPDVVFRARADRAEVEQQLAEARERAASARRAVNQLAGRALEAPLDPVPGDVATRPLPMPRAAAIASALQRREELAQLSAGVAAAQAGVRAATAAFLPSVAIAVDYGAQGRSVRFDRASDYVIGSLVLSWNLFNGGGDIARRDALRGETARLGALQRDLVTKVQLDVMQAYDAAEVAFGAVATAEERVLAARRAYTLVQRRYEEGVANLIELIDVRTALTGAELNRSLTEYRYAMRLVDLERAAALRELDEGRGS